MTLQEYIIGSSLDKEEVHYVHVLKLLFIIVAMSTMIKRNYN